MLAAKGQIDYALFLATLVGVSLVVASGCVFNNYIDRDIDRKWKEPKTGPGARINFSDNHSGLHAMVLGIAGFVLLYLAVNPLAI